MGFEKNMASPFSLIRNTFLSKIYRVDIEEPKNRNGASVPYHCASPLLIPIP